MTAAPHRPHPRESAQRCSLRSQLRGDPLLGTAFPAARVLMVEQPGPWGRDGLVSSHFDRAVAEKLVQRAADAGIRVQAVRRPGRTRAGALRTWMLADTRDGHEALHAGTYTADAELLDLPLDGSAGTRDDALLYLVCTHSKHDTCCALRGRPLAAALDAHRPGRVWESSHLGGDRFAANVLVLPLGLLYGRVAPIAAPEFVAAAEADEVVGALLRGRIGQPPPVQAALAFAHEQLALRFRRDVRVIDHTPVVDGTSTVRLAGPHGEVDVVVAVERVEAAGLTCAKPGPNSYLRHRPLTLTPVA